MKWKEVEKKQPKKHAFFAQINSSHEDGSGI